MNIKADTFKRIRESRNLTQQQLADKMSCTRNYISMVENGKKKPNDKWIELWKQKVYE